MCTKSDSKSNSLNILYHYNCFGLQSVLQSCLFVNFYVICLTTPNNKNMEVLFSDYSIDNLYNAQL